MSSCINDDVGETSEQICYIPCNFCNIALAVSVPCRSLYETVTIRCGHCSNLWSVNMAAAAFQAPSTWQDQHAQASKYTNSTASGIDLGSSLAGCNDQMVIQQQTLNPTAQRIENQPPEKKQRVPSAYNQFIKEEIQRIKAHNPAISHREAFSAAAKNWAHFPRIHFGLVEEQQQQPT